MMQLIACAIVCVSLFVYTCIEENARIHTQEKADNTDWNTYYANK